MQKKIPSTAITERQLRRKIRKAAEDHGSLSAWAVENDITPQQVTSFMRKTQGAGLKIPEVLGYRPQIVFIPLDEELISTMNPPRRETKRPTKKVDHTRRPVERRKARR